MGTQALRELPLYRVQNFVLCNHRPVKWQSDQPIDPSSEKKFFLNHVACWFSHFGNKTTAGKTNTKCACTMLLLLLLLNIFTIHFTFYGNGFTVPFSLNALKTIKLKKSAINRTEANTANKQTWNTIIFFRKLNCLVSFFFLFLFLNFFKLPLLTVPF